MELNHKQGDTRIRPNQKNQQDNARSTAVEVIEVESLSHFSFGIKPTATTTNKGRQQGTGKAINHANELNLEQMQGQ